MFTNRQRSEAETFRQEKLITRNQQNFNYLRQVCLDKNEILGKKCRAEKGIFRRREIVKH